jgi:LacI family sucrose operon transcriptional repressor
MEGLNIPEDLSITGFGGYEVTEITHPSITTVKYFYKEAGVLAAKNIVKLVNSDELEKITITNFDIIIRDSVDRLS